ncbi:MAG: T9SS type A sorting domain-containing protein [Bacteroidales bacterium]|jgi:hypothetical protein|nr:T9SS type A sorting domain-containing protein [Bacteroidales bacterium]MDD4214968.1 T9SS type A sorting domain-containing protein [Bacteroidales bacterium]
MKLFLFMLFFVFIQLKLSAQCANPANIYSFSYGGKNYELVKEEKTWSDAASCAVERGGVLVEINDLAEQTAVYNGIVSSGIANNYKPVMDGGGTSYVWIGATDKATEGTWLWDGNGDDSGVTFWTGQGAAGANNGATVGGAYVNWGGTSTAVYKEPDDFSSNQDGAAIALTGWPYGSTSLGITGEWNDISVTNTIYYIIEFETSGIGGNNEINGGFVLTPNPCNETIQIDGPKTVKNLKVYNFNGALVLQKENLSGSKIHINTTPLKPGQYILLIECEKRSYYSLPFVRK